MKEKSETHIETEPMPEVNQPGLSALREAVSVAEARYQRRKTIRQDGVAGLNTAVANVPDGLANGVLVGVNPLFGLYAAMIGPFVGGLFSSTQRMMVTTTAAASMTASQALAAFPSPLRERALFLMVIMVGGFQLLFGLLRLGRLTRFVSYSVTTGFLLGISVLLILSQLPTIAGVRVSGGNKVSQTFSILTHPRAIDPWSVGLAILTLLLAATLTRSPLGKVGSLLAIVIPSLFVGWLGIASVQIVDDIGDIPRMFPRPFLPSLLDTVDVITGALSVATVILVQGAGVSQSVPNTNGKPANMSRDFSAQGAANIASGVFHGLPVGGSLSSTAFSILSGAQSRGTALFAGLWMAMLLILLPNPVAHIAMPALGALLIWAGVRSIKPQSLSAVWRAGWQARLAAGTTFAATLFLPIQAAVAIGVSLSMLLYVYASSSDISVVEWVEQANGSIRERTPPKILPSSKVTVLDVYGHLFFAGARTLEQLLPAPQGAEHPVVVLRMRGRTHQDATLIEVLTNYARQLREAGGRLLMSGVNPTVYEKIIKERKLQGFERVEFFKATPTLGESTRAAKAAAQQWLDSLK